MLSCYCGICILCLALVSCGGTAGRLGSESQCVLLLPLLLSFLLQVMASAADGGFGACFAAAGVHGNIIAKFAEEGVESLAEFVGYFTASGFEKEAENVRDKVESLKGRTVETARIRTAHQIAVKVVEVSNAETKKETPAQVHLDM